MGELNFLFEAGDFVVPFPEECVGALLLLLKFVLDLD